MARLIYTHPSLYRWIMRALYGKGDAQRFSEIGKWIAPNSRVLDLCAGPGDLYLKILKEKQVDYTAAELSPAFCDGLRKAGAQVFEGDIRNLEFPEGSFDVVLMQASLYHFIPKEQEILQKMLFWSKRFVIVTEPIRNLSSHPNPLVAGMAKILSDPGDGGGKNRFDKTSLQESFAPFKAKITHQGEINNGRDFLIVLDKKV